MILEDLELRQRVEGSPKKIIEVNYGDAKSVGSNEEIRTRDNLYECVGVILLNKGNTAFAHFPLGDKFTVIEEDGGEERRVARTFDGLLETLFLKFGTISEDTEAQIVGGVEGKSERLIKKIAEILDERGVKKIKIKGPHSDKVDWDISVVQRNVKIKAHRRLV